MGRKSKKKKGKGASRQPSANEKGKGVSRQPHANEKDTSAKVSMPPAAPGASCWICLDEGEVLVRECSCRGDSAGFAHASCLIQYAETKCVSINQYNQQSLDTEWSKPFTVCPNCNQKYRGELAIALATARVHFVDEKQLGLYYHLTALQEQLATIVGQRRFSVAKVEESEEIVKKCTSVVDQMKADTALWSMLLSNKDVLAAEATHIALMGNVYLAGEDAESGRKALECYEKVKRVDPEMYAILDAKVAEAKALCEGKKEKEVDFDVKVKGKNIEGIRLNYQQTVKEYGEGSEEAIRVGLDLIMALKKGLRIMDAERLADKLAPLSQRILGPDHPYTECIEVMHRRLKERVVFIHRGNDLEEFLALRYVRRGKKCVVQGPLQNPRNVDKEKTFEVNTHSIIPSFETPVICHGLKSAAHLNGRVGDMRSVGEGHGKDRFLVYLEGKKEPVLVKLENLRIAFDLPEPTTAGESSG